MTDERIKKLPKWAVEYISNLEQQADEANRLLSAMIDEQTPTPVYTLDIRSIEPTTGKRFIRRYFDVRSHVCVNHDGILLDITLPQGLQGRQGIELSWLTSDHKTRDVIFQPIGFQTARLVLPKKE